MRRRKKRNNNNKKAKKTHNHDKIIVWIGTRMYVCMYWQKLFLYSPHSFSWVLSCFLTFICWRQREDNTNHAGRCFSLGEERHWSPTFIEKQTLRDRVDRAGMIASFLFRTKHPYLSKFILRNCMSIVFFISVVGVGRLLAASGPPRFSRFDCFSILRKQHHDSTQTTKSDAELRAHSYMSTQVYMASICFSVSHAMQCQVV